MYTIQIILYHIVYIYTHMYNTRRNSHLQTPIATSKFQGARKWLGISSSKTSPCWSSPLAGAFHGGHGYLDRIFLEDMYPLVN